MWAGIKTNLRAIQKSQTLLINEQSRLMARRGEKVYKLGFGQSPFKPLERVQRALQESSGLCGYVPVQGLPELREAAVRFHNAKQPELSLTSDRCLVGPGSKMLLYIIMASFKRADVLIPSPAWVSYEPQAHLLDHSVTRIRTTIENRWRVTPEGLDEAASRSPDGVQKILILNTPGNPDGLIYEQKELQELAVVMRKWSILVVADEIYALLTHKYSTGKFKSLAAYYPEGTIITTGLSKWSGAGGWRLGLLFLPEESDELKDVLLGIASETYSCAPGMVQQAAVVAYTHDDVTEAYLQSQRSILRILAEVLYSMLNAVGIGVHRAQGGFYLFLDFHQFKGNLELKLGITTSASLCEDILNKTGVALLPSNAFGFPSTHLSARLAYVDFDGDAALSLAELNGKVVDEDLVHKACGNTIEGVEKLCEYFALVAVDRC